MPMFHFDYAQDHLWSDSKFFGIRKHNHLKWITNSGLYMVIKMTGYKVISHTYTYFIDLEYKVCSGASNGPHFYQNVTRTGFWNFYQNFYQNSQIISHSTSWFISQNIPHTSKYILNLPENMTKITKAWFFSEFCS